MKGSFAVTAALIGILLNPAAGFAETPRETSTASEMDMDAIRARKKELMKLVDRLEVKLPPELSRKLLILSMKIYTGYCAPYPAKEFEDAVNALPQSARAKFAKEWDELRTHPEWPDTSVLRNSPDSDGTSEEGPCDQPSEVQ